MTDNVMFRIQRAIDATKGWGEPAHCDHCGAETEGEEEYCPICLPFYEEKKAPSLWRQMKLFQREWSTKFWAATDKRYVLCFSENDPSFRVISTGNCWQVAQFHYVPVLDEIVAAALGECTCKPDRDACPTCSALARMTAGDELPF